MRSTFRELLNYLLDQALVGEQFDSYRDFIRKSEPGRDENSGVAYLSKVLAGDAPPPLQRVRGWADALRLKGQDRQEFLDLATREHIPDEEWDRLAEVRQENADLLKRFHEFETVLGLDPDELERLLNYLRLHPEMAASPDSSGHPVPPGPHTDPQDTALPAQEDYARLGRAVEAARKKRNPKQGA